MRNSFVSDCQNKSTINTRLVAKICDGVPGLVGRASGNHGTDVSFAPVSTHYLLFGSPVPPRFLSVGRGGNEVESGYHQDGNKVVTGSLKTVINHTGIYPEIRACSKNMQIIKIHWRLSKAFVP